MMDLNVSLSGFYNGIVKVTQIFAFGIACQQVSQKSSLRNQLANQKQISRLQQLALYPYLLSSS